MLVVKHMYSLRITLLSCLPQHSTVKFPPHLVKRDIFSKRPCLTELLQAAAQLPNEVFQVALQCLRTGKGRVAEAALDLMGCLVTGPGGVDPAM